MRYIEVLSVKIYKVKTILISAVGVLTLLTIDYRLIEASNGL